MIDRAIEACGDRPTVVVASPALAPQIATNDRRLVIVNDAPERGMSCSLRLALDMLDSSVPIAVLLGDMPFVTAALLDRLESAREASDDVCFPALDGRPSHPVIFGPRMRSMLLALPDGDTLRGARDAPGRHRRAVIVEDGAIARDIDTPADLAAADPLRAGRREAAE